MFHPERDALHTNALAYVADVLWNNASYSGSGSGPGRNDSFQFILNNTNCTVLGVEENCLPAEGKPLRFAPVWGATNLEWDHHNNQAYNPVLRSFIAMAGYPFGSFKDGVFDLNINVQAVRDTLALLKKLEHPGWPEDIFGPLDQGKEARGAEVFGEKCASCHTLPPHNLTDPAINPYGKQFIQSVSVPIDLTYSSPASAQNIGTDPGTLRVYFYQTMQPGPLTPFIPPAYMNADGSTSASVLFNVAITTALQQQLATLNLAPEQMPEFFFFKDFRSPSLQQLASVRARLPEGIGWKGNYLHNGAIRSLYELLLPEAERAEQFVVGDHEFDPDTLGYKNRTGQPQEFVLDTRLPGNGNRGHSGPAYGTDMSDADRRAVIEFLKAL